MSETGLGRPDGLGRDGSAFAPIARTTIEPTPPVEVVAGWAVSGRRSRARLRITDDTPLAKVQVKAREGGAAADAIGVAHLAARRDEDDALVVGSGPGEWLLLAPPGQADAVAARYAERLERSGDFVTVIDLTHGRALMRLTGPDAPATLAKVCGIDLSDDVTPDGTAFRSSVARVVTDVIRDDRDGTPSYLLHVETSSGQYLFDSLVDAGEEFGIDIDGFALPGI